MSVTYRDAAGNELDADGRRIGSKAEEEERASRFRVTYMDADGFERYPDGMLVKREPTDRENITAPPTPAVIVASRSINPSFEPSRMSPGELAAASMTLIEENDDRELVDEDRALLAANIRAEVQARHLQEQIDSGTDAAPPPPPPTWGAGNQLGNMLTDGPGTEQQTLGNSAVAPVSVLTVTTDDDAELTPAQKAARVRAINKAKEEAEQQEADAKAEEERLKAEAAKKAEEQGGN